MYFTLRGFTSDQPRKWYKFLHLAEYWFNTSFHSAIQMTPFKALYGREPPNISDYLCEAVADISLRDSLSLRRLGVVTVASMLDLPSSSRIHPVVHVSLLRPYFSEDGNQEFLPLPFDADLRFQEEANEFSLSPKPPCLREEAMRLEKQKASEEMGLELFGAKRNTQSKFIDITNN